MPRTAARPIPSGRITKKEALFFCLVTGISGLAILYRIQLSLFVLGIFAMFSYNVLYTLWWKKTMAFGAVPGAIPGALPILMGHVAADGNWQSPGGWFLFFILFFWQMPHFWSLAIRYSDDYKQGGIPTLPVVKGVPVTVFQIAFWCLAYIALSLSAPLFIRVGSVYLGTAIVTGVILVWQLRNFLKNEASKTWLKFFLWVNFSLIFYLVGLAADQWSIYLVPYLKN
jgi:heme o synthase